MIDGVIVPVASYKWSRENVKEFGNSILSGSPRGGIFCWNPGRHVGLEDSIRQDRLGPISLPALTKRTWDVAFLLDGHNRLVSVAWMAHDFSKPPPEDITEQERKVWCGDEKLVIDLTSGQLEWVSSNKAETGFVLPAWTLFSSANNEIRSRMFGAWADISSEKKKGGIRTHEEAKEKFEANNYVPYMTVKCRDVEELTQALIDAECSVSDADLDILHLWTLRQDDEIQKPSSNQ